MEGGEQGNYWPGFVDALSNMVMAMIFMVLIFMIVLFHYKLHQGPSPYPAPAGAPTSSSAVAGKTAGTDASAHVAQLQAEVNRLKQALEQAQATHQGEQPVRKPVPTAGTNNVASVLDQPDAISSKDDFVSGNKTAGKNPPTVTGDGSILTIMYQGRAPTLDPSAKEKFQGFIAPLASRKDTLHMKIIAEATQGVGYSDARRIAYYRAIELRNLLLQAGWSSTAIDLEIVDRTAQHGEPRVLIQPMPANTPGGHAS